MISTATSRSPPPAPSQQQQRRRVVRFRAITTIDDVGHDAATGAAAKDSEETLLPFGIKRVEVGPTKVDLAFASDSNNNASGLLSLALGQGPRGSGTGTPARRVRTSLGRLSSELLSEEKLGATPPLFVSATAATTLTPPRKSNPIPIGASSLSPSRASSAAVKPAATANKELQQQQKLEKKENKAFDASGSWTQRVTFYPVVTAAAAPVAPAPSTPVKDIAVVPQLSSSQGSDSSSGNETDDGTSASPKSVFEVRGVRKQQQKEAVTKPIAGTPIPVVVAAEAPKKDANNDDDGWRLRFRRRWRRERLYAAIGVFPRSPPKDYFDDFNNLPGADALSAAVAGAFDDADASVAFGDGEW